MGRKLTKNTIKPVVRYIKAFGDDVHSLNTKGSKYYSFTLDTFSGKSSFQGGFDWDIEDALKYEEFAIELSTGDVYNKDKEVIMEVEL